MYVLNYNSIFIARWASISIEKQAGKKSLSARTLTEKRLIPTENLFSKL